MGNCSSCCTQEDENKGEVINVVSTAPSKNKTSTQADDNKVGAVIEPEVAKIEIDHFHEQNMYTDLEPYYNDNVNDIMKQLGDFDYGEMVTNDKLEYKPLRLLQTGAQYEGQFRKGTDIREGMGKQIWADGSIYEGFWGDSKANGRGRLIHADGDIYEGDWINDKAEGFGIYRHLDGARYEGFWHEDRQHGKGIETWPDGAWYEGEYDMGKKHGSGLFKWSDGSSYEGEFSNNNIEGKGTYKWGDGREYVGDWKDNKMHGEGVFYWPDGRKYKGEYKNDK